MTELLVQVGLSNFLLSAALASVAYAIHRHGRYPALAHLLWLFVLAKTLTPPLLSVPVVPGLVGTDAAAAGAAGTAGNAAVAVVAGAAGLGSVATWLDEHAATLIVLAWATGSVLVLTASLLRIRRFGRLLGQTSTEAPAQVQALAQAVARPLGLGSAPTICLSSARLSAMTWWTGGRVRIILPEPLVRSVDEQELRWVLAHELAHVRRHDHLVRWLEWLACVAFWWNPVVWWARRNLRLDEEDACDALVLERMEGQPRSYARTLLTAVEVMAEPRADAPALATGIDAARSLERRLTRIISPVGMSKPPRRLVVGLAAVAMMLMTVGVGGATGEMASDARLTEAGVLGATQGPPADAAGALAEPSSGEEHYALVSADTSAVSRSEAINGSNRPDQLHGTADDDVIRGRKGADVIAGKSGADRLEGGPGKDIVKGGAGNDIIDGGPGKDIVKGGAGNDIIRAWRDGEADRIDCGPGTRDRAVVDRTDTTRRCEVVVVRDPS